MEILKLLQREEIKSVLSEFAGDHDYGSIVEVLLMPFVYLVDIYPSDFDLILINSNAESRELDRSEYPSVMSVIQSIQSDAGFFQTTRGDRGLDGTLVKRYRDEFVNGSAKPKPAFLVDRTEFAGMNEAGVFYIRDSMHHLVAYGLATGMRDDAFPITGYYGSRSAQNTPGSMKRDNQE